MSSNPVSHKISKIITVLQENHTFDNYFGTYLGADGTSGKNICLPQKPNSANCVSPYHDTNLTPVDMNHDWNTAHADYDNGKMDGFVYSEGSSETMGYYDRKDIPHYWSAADNYVLCDRYFTSAMSESAPNHLFLVAGTCGGIISDSVPKTIRFPPVFQELDQRGITWKVYGFTSWYESFAYVQNNSPSKQNFSSSSASFVEDLKAGNIPQVSWIIGAPGGDEHPPANVQLGENSVANDIINSIGASPVWESAVIFVTWDDFGGFYDHVNPPQVDHFGYGFRVPCLVVSPFSKKGFVDSTTNDHASILKFVENRFGLSALSTRDQAANDLSEAFDFSKPPRTFIRV
jgi:phospholipase C